MNLHKKVSKTLITIPIVSVLLFSSSCVSNPNKHVLIKINNYDSLLSYMVSGSFDDLITHKTKNDFSNYDTQEEYEQESAIVLQELKASDMAAIALSGFMTILIADSLFDGIENFKNLSLEVNKTQSNEFSIDFEFKLNDEDKYIRTKENVLINYFVGEDVNTQEFAWLIPALDGWDIDLFQHFTVKNEDEATWETNIGGGIIDLIDETLIFTLLPWYTDKIFHEWKWSGEE